MEPHSLRRRGAEGGGRRRGNWKDDVSKKGIPRVTQPATAPPLAVSWTWTDLAINGGNERAGKRQKHAPARGGREGGRGSGYRMAGSPVTFCTLLSPS